MRDCCSAARRELAFLTLGLGTLLAIAYWTDPLRYLAAPVTLTDRWRMEEILASLVALVLAGAIFGTETPLCIVAHIDAPGPMVGPGPQVLATITTPLARREPIQISASGQHLLAGPVCLSERERAVLDLLLLTEEERRLARKEIARRLAISEDTVKTHMRHIARKLGAEDASREAILHAARHYDARY